MGKEHGWGQLARSMGGANVGPTHAPCPLAPPMLVAHYIGPTHTPCQLAQHGWDQLATSMGGANWQGAWVGAIGKEHGCGHWATSTGVANGQTDSYLLELLGSDMTCPVHSVMYCHV